MESDLPPRHPSVKRFGRKRTPFAVLGFLATSPKSGYDIKLAMARSTAYFWNESFGQIYPILTMLEQEGLITKGAEERSGKRSSQKYEITDQGRDALKAWLSEPIAQLTPRNELLLKVFFGRHIAPSVLIGHLRDYRAQQARQLAIYTDYRRDYNASVDSEEHPHLRYLLAPLEHGLRTSQTLMEWCDETIAALEKHDAGQEGAKAASLPPR